MNTSFLKTSNGKKRLLPKISSSLFPFVDKPYIVYLNLLQRCNLRCSYCFGQYYKETAELSLEKLSKILAELYDLGARRVNISGGEALLYKDIDALIENAVGIGFDVGIVSNGILVPRHLNALKLVSNLTISVDGATPETHDKYRGKGSFEKAIGGLEAASEADIPLNIACVLSDANAEEWPQVLELGKKYHAPVQMSPLYGQFRGDEETDCPRPLAKEQFKKVITDILEAKKKGANVYFSEDTYRLILGWPDFNQDTSTIRETGHPVCLAGKKTVALDPHGKLYPCMRLTEEVEGQDCTRQSVKEAYKNLPTPPCKSCLWACYVEQNSLTNLRPEPILNLLRNRFFSRNTNGKSNHSFASDAKHA